MIVQSPNRLLAEYSLIFTVLYGSPCLLSLSVWWCFEPSCSRHTGLLDLPWTRSRRRRRARAVQLQSLILSLFNMLIFCWSITFFFALMLTSKHCNKVFFIPDDWILRSFLKRYTIDECLLLSPSLLECTQARLWLFACCFFCLVQLFPVTECPAALLCPDFCPYGFSCSSPWPSPANSALLPCCLLLHGLSEQSSLPDMISHVCLHLYLVKGESSRVTRYCFRKGQGTE